MKLLIISTEFPPGPGGIATQAEQLARHLSIFGWQVTVLTSQDYASLQERIEFNGTRNYAIRRFRPLRPAPIEAAYRVCRLMSEIDRHRPHAILATGMRAVWLSALPSRLFGIPSVAIGHGTEFGLPQGLTRTLSRWAYGKSTAVVCVSEYTQQQMRRMGVRSELSGIIHNGADASQFVPHQFEKSAAYRKRIGFEDEPLLLTVGRVSKRKGQDVVIRSMPRILSHVPNAQYLMAGIPEKGEEFRQLARQLGVEKNVHILGRVDEHEVVQLMNACDLFVMTSTKTNDGDVEGFGIAVVEAALCGRPAVVASGSGLTEAIEDGVTGMAVPQNDADDTAEAVIRLLLNQNERLEMGRAARIRALENQTWEQCARRYDALLRDIAVIPQRPKRLELAPSA